MKKSLLLAGLAGMALGAILGCAKKEEPVAAAPATPAASKPETVELVKKGERSSHFLAVQRQLELGGTLYAYADVEGDVFKIAGTLQMILEQVAQAQPQVAPFVKQDYKALFSTLGLDDIKAIGLSSVPEGDGYFRNRVFLHTPDGRHGLLASLGGAPTSFAKLKLAPAGTDFYSESEMDLAEIYKVVKAVVARVGGDTSANQMEEKIKQAGEAAAISLLGLINDWKGHSAMVLRLDPEKNLTLPGLVIPAPSLLICIDGIANHLEPLLKNVPGLKVTTEGNRRVYRSAQPLPLPGLDPVVVLDGTTLYLATSTAFLDECLKHASGLEQVPAFQQALAHVGTSGNGLAYVSPAFFTRLRDLEKLNPGLAPQGKQVLAMILQNLPEKPTQALVTVRRNLPDGILVQSHWNRSLKQDLAGIAVYNPVTVGLLAAMAIPAFEKVRTTSQEKAILNNLRQLAAAADQYYLENGVDTTDYDKLVGADKYVRRIDSVAGESYRGLTFRHGMPLAVTTADGRQVSYPPAAPAMRSSGGPRAPVQTLVLTATGDNRVKVVQDSDGAVLFDGPLANGESKSFRKQGLLLMTVQSGKDLRMEVNGRNFPVPVEAYGRFRLD